MPEIRLCAAVIGLGLLFGLFLRELKAAHVRHTLSRDPEFDLIFPEEE